MSRRMVIRCDECGNAADMVNPAWMNSTSASMGGAQQFFGTMEIKPRPPEGWYERYGGMRGMLDFCSAACASAWDDRQSKDRVTA